VHVNPLEGVWSLLRSWLRPHRGISQEKLPLYLGFFEFVHNARRRGKALTKRTLVDLGSSLIHRKSEDQFATTEKVFSLLRVHLQEVFFEALIAIGKLYMLQD
jgi:hypothetical protein